MEPWAEAKGMVANASRQACPTHIDRRDSHHRVWLSEGPESSRALGHRARPPKSTCISKPSYLEDKLESALLRTSGVSSAEVTGGAASARLSLSDAVSPSTFKSGSGSCTAETQKRKRFKMLSRIQGRTHLSPEICGKRLEQGLRTRHTQVT